MKKSDVVRKYVEKFPEHGNRTLASLVLKENPNLFSSIDSARSSVRYVRGNQGKLNRSYRKKETGVFKPNGKAGEYKIPKSLTPKKRIVRIPNGKTLLLSDIHLPYHDVEALECLGPRTRRYQCCAQRRHCRLLCYQSLGH